MSDIGIPDNIAAALAAREHPGRTTGVCYIICGAVLLAEPGESIVVYLPMWRWLDHVVPTLEWAAEEYGLKMTRDHRHAVTLYDSEHSATVTFIVPNDKGVLRGRNDTIVDGLMREYVDGGGYGESVDAWERSLR